MYKIRALVIVLGVFGCVLLNLSVASAQIRTLALRNVELKATGTSSSFGVHLDQETNILLDISYSKIEALGSPNITKKGNLSGGRFGSNYVELKGCRNYKDGRGDFCQHLTSVERSFWRAGRPQGQIHGRAAWPYGTRMACSTQPAVLNNHKLTSQRLEATLVGSLFQLWNSWLPTVDNLLNFFEANDGNAQFLSTLAMPALM